MIIHAEQNTQIVKTYSAIKAKTGIVLKLNMSFPTNKGYKVIHLKHEKYQNIK